MPFHFFFKFAVSLLLACLICVDDALHEWMTHDIFLLIFDNADALDATQDLEGLHEAALGGAGQVDLGGLALMPRRVRNIFI